MSFRGVLFNPPGFPESYPLETYGLPWLVNQRPAWDWAQRLREDLKWGVAPVIFLSVPRPGMLSWPLPTNEEIEGLSKFVQEVRAHCPAPLLNISLPWTLTDEEFGGDGVTGHIAGEVINGRELFWDIPETPSNNREVCRDWWLALVDGLALLLDVGDLFGLVHRGTPKLATGGEWPGGESFVGRDHLAAYAHEVLPQIRAASPWPIGAHLSPELHSSNVEPLQWWESQGILDAADFVDVTVGRGVSAREVASIFPASKAVVSDFKTYHPETPVPAVAHLMRELADVRELGFMGAWHWNMVADTPARSLTSFYRSDGTRNTAISGLWGAEARNFSY